MDSVYENFTHQLALDRGARLDIGRELSEQDTASMLDAAYFDPEMLVVSHSCKVY